jgi:putative two-component system response regulator
MDTLKGTSGPDLRTRCALSRQAVLIVDDESACAHRLARLLSDEGLDTHVVPNGEAALQSVDQHPPDIVLLDVGLPGLNGFEICRRIKADVARRLIPVILVTGLHGREHRIAGINAGADDFISKPIDTEQLKARVRSLLSLKQYTNELESAESVIISMALMVEARDPYTAGHCERLAKYAGALGSALGLGDAELDALRRGGYLHDVGKIAIPDSILLKKGRLTPEEYTLMKRHPVIGAELCGRLQSLTPVRPIVRHHHERLDGSGYPDGLRGTAIPLLAQIISVVDVFDALTTMRPYRAAMTPVWACEALIEDATRGWLNPDLVSVFVDLVRGPFSPSAVDLGILR